MDFNIEFELLPRAAGADEPMTVREGADGLALGGVFGRWNSDEGGAAIHPR